MRTTLTIDEDVAVRLERLRRERRLKLKAVVNQALRVGLERMEQPESMPAARCRIKGVSLGRKLPNLDNIAEVLASSEAESWK